MSTGLHVGILAGEMSGDVLGAGLMQALRRLHPDIHFSGIGGPLMSAEGLQSRVPMERLSVMGLVEPLKRLPELLRLRRDLASFYISDKPDVFIGIDSPDFNLGLERRLKNAGIPVVHYVSPSVWAWRQKRIHRIREAVNLMLCLFPFEEDIYRENGIPVCCTGHTLADQMPLENDTLTARKKLGLDTDKPVLAVLPGSRESEVARLGPAFMEVADHCQHAEHGLQVVIPSANASCRKHLEEQLAEHPELDVLLIDGKASTAMAAADRILIASGTATLEALLCKKPMVVCYRMAALSYAIISRMLKVPYFSLPNLLAKEKLVPELVQDEVNADRLFAELLHLSADRGEELKERFTEIHHDLKRGASERAANAVMELVRSRQGG